MSTVSNNKKTFIGEPPSNPDYIPDFVSEISEIEFTGNIIPHTWYSHLTYKSRYGKKPYLLAILILSDILYWSRRSEIRDEETGKFLKYKKKFKYNMIQKSYSAYAELFGESEHNVKEAINYLEDMGCIIREFWNFKPEGRSFQSNVMFLAPISSKIKIMNEPYKSDENTTHMSGYAPTGTHPMDQLVHTYTEITTENTKYNDRSGDRCNTNSLSLDLNTTKDCSSNLKKEKEPNIVRPDSDHNSADRSNWDLNWLRSNLAINQHDPEYCKAKPTLAEFLYFCEQQCIDKKYAENTYKSWYNRDWKFESGDVIKNWMGMVITCYKLRQSNIKENEKRLVKCDCGKNYLKPVLDREDDEDLDDYICQCGRRKEVILE